VAAFCDHEFLPAFVVVVFACGTEAADCLYWLEVSVGLEKELEGRDCGRPAQAVESMFVDDVQVAVGFVAEAYFSFAHAEGDLIGFCSRLQLFC